MVIIGELNRAKKIAPHFKIKRTVKIARFFSIFVHSATVKFKGSKEDFILSQ